MKLFLRNISLVVLSTLAVFLSMGVSISKMQCSKDGSLYLGTEVPNCMEKQVTSCAMDVEKISCCKKKEIKESCCPQTKDNSCAGETVNIQFDFETTFAIVNFNFLLLEVPLFYTVSNHNFASNLIANQYQTDIPPQKLNKPQLAQIQSFLL
jgi:hypothetical protein